MPSCVGGICQCLPGVVTFKSLSWFSLFLCVDTFNSKYCIEYCGTVVFCCTSKEYLVLWNRPLLRSSPQHDEGGPCPPFSTHKKPNLHCRPLFINPESVPRKLVAEQNTSQGRSELSKHRKLIESGNDVVCSVLFSDSSGFSVVSKLENVKNYRF